MDPAEKVIDPAPGVGEKVGVPHPEVEEPAGVSTTIAPGKVGKVSEKDTPSSVIGNGLVNVKVSFEEPLTLVGSGAKSFAIVTREGSTIAAYRVDTSKSAL